MNKVPEMISTKDLAYISDMMEWFIVDAKKAEDFSNQVSDSEIKKALKSVKKLHTSHCETLLNILNKGGSYEQE